MNITERTTVLGVNKRIAKTVHGIMLFGMLHSTFVAPAQVVLIDYFNAPKPVVTKWDTFYEEQKKHTDEGQIIQGETSSLVSEKTVSTIKTSERSNTGHIYYADIWEGFIGLSEQHPMDDVRDNVFVLTINEIPQQTKAYLIYELYGVEGGNSVSKSINHLPSTGGQLIKRYNGWSEQQEELDINWLKEGENTVLFTAPSIKGYGYKIRNLRIKFAESSDFTPSLVLNIDKKGLLVKENRVYVKGFVSKPKGTISVEANGNLLSVYENQFEGFVELTENNKYIVIKASDRSGLLGQEVIALADLIEADLLVPFEESSNATMKLFPAFSKNELYTDGAGIIVPDSALIEKKNISIAQLRKKDIAPLNSGMINVTKNGLAYRFLPDGTKFEKEAKILLEYDPSLIPSGYSEKDIQTFYFNTKSKKWVSIRKDSVDFSNKMIISNTDHFTDYINGIIQVPETPESSAFIPTMMSDIKAADPSAGITLISPSEVSQKGSAGVSYPIKIPMGRNGMQPSLAIQYNSDGGNGFLGQGWDISIPAITIDTRWGVPVLADTLETEIYTLNGEQLMYPKIENLENEYEDWMPNRHYFDGLDGNNNPIYNTTPRGRIENAIFTPRKQGSFAKIERLGTNPEDYYWKVTGTDGTISWYGGKTAVVDNSVLKNTENKVVHWNLYMVEDVFGNNIKYEYEKELISTTGINANLNGGTFYRINKISYTGHNGSDGGYSVEFNPTSTMRQDISIDSRLGVKLVTPRLLSDIEIKEGTQLIRKYNLLYGTGKFGKNRLEAVAETNGSNEEFYRHEFEYYDDLNQDGNDIYFSSGVDINTCFDEEDSNLAKCYTVSFPIPRNTFCEYKLSSSVTSFTTTNDPLLFCSGYKIGDIKINNQIFNQSNLLYLSCGSGGQPDSSNCLMPSEYLNYTNSNPYFGNSNVDYYNDSEIIANQIFNAFPEIISIPSFVVPNISSDKIVGENHYIPSSNIVHYKIFTTRVFRFSSTSDSMLVSVNTKSPFFSGGVIHTIQPSSIISFLIPSYAHINGNPIYDNSYIYFTNQQSGFSTFRNHILDVYPNSDVTLNNNIITINVKTTQDLSTINLTSVDNQTSNTYNFVEVSCSQSGMKQKQEDQDIALTENDWKNYKPSKKEVEFYEIKNIADGNELNQSIDFVLEYAFLLEESTDDLLSGNYFWYKSYNEEFWKNEEGGLISDKGSVSILDRLSNVRNIYSEIKKVNEKEESERRLIAQKEAKEWIKNNNLYKDFEESNRLVITNKQQYNSFSDLSKMEAKADFNHSNFSERTSSFINNSLQPNYLYTFESLFGDPDCPSMVNAEFLLEGLIPSFNSYLSPLGSTSTTSASVGGYLGVGLGCKWYTKSITFGVQKNWYKDKSTGMTTMVDINGDGLNDIVTKLNGSLYYQPHIIEYSADENGVQTVNHSFGAMKPISGINNFYRAKGGSKSTNFQVTFGVGSFGGFFGLDTAESDSTSDIYFTDANGDGLIDIVRNGVVYFNRLDIAGNPHFFRNSIGTENLVIVAEPMSVEEPAVGGTIEFPGYDVVKVWEAPADGTISIDNLIQLTDITKKATVTIEIKPPSGIIEPDCSECTECDLCPECEHCGDDECTTCTDCSECPECEICVRCFIIERFYQPSVQNPATLYVNGVPVQGNPFQSISSLIAALEALFPGYFTYEDINGGSGDLHYYGPEMPDIMIIPHPFTAPYHFMPCPPEGLQGGLISGGYMMQTLSAGQDCLDTGNLCLLFWADLNSTRTVVNELITLFSGYCTSGEAAESLRVKKGDRVYFRVHSVENGNPPVKWDPKITYTNTALNSITDQNGNTVYKSSYSDGFIISAFQPFMFPGNDGEANIGWEPFDVDYPSDDVVFEIVKGTINGTANSNNDTVSEEVIFKKTCYANTENTVSPLIADFPLIDELDEINVSIGTNVESNYSGVYFHFRVRSTSNVDWKSYEWHPSITTTTSQEVTGADGTTPEGMLTSVETHYPVIDYSIYKLYPCSPQYSLFDISQVNGGLVSGIEPNLENVFDNDDNGTIHFVVKNNGKLVGKRLITVNNGNVTIDDLDPIDLTNLTTNTNIEIGYYIDDSGLFDNLTSLLSKIANASEATAVFTYQSSTYDVPGNVINLFQKPNPKFGPMLRQWGQFMYNPGAVENVIVAPFGNLINEESLFYDQDLPDTIQDYVNYIEGIGDDGITQQILEDFQIATANVYNQALLVASPSKGANTLSDKWIGLSSENYASALFYRAATMEQSLDTDFDVEPYNFQDMLQTGAYGINKISEGDNLNLSGGASIDTGIGISAGANASRTLTGNSRVLTDYVDFNGDRYPDILTNQQIQLTNRTGGLKGVGSRQGSIAVHKSEGWGIGASGSYSKGGDKGGEISSPAKLKVNFEGFRGNGGAGLSANFSKGKSITDRAWIDVNGDGLPDLFEKDSDGVVEVRLNDGRGGTENSSFVWLFPRLFDSDSENISGGLGINKWTGSFEAGVSVTSAWNSTKNTLVDINGDGLLDYVNTGNGISVRLNQGNRLISSPVNWSGWNLKNESVSVGANINVGATGAWIWLIPIPFGTLCLKLPVITVSGSPYGTTTNKTEKMITDFDGDGFPDLIEKINEGVIRVYHSRIRRTDKLKSVTNPLGGKFTVDYKVHKVDYDNPNPKWVMSSVEIEDGYDGVVNDGHNTYKKEFVYENPRYDRRERDFYGFETIKTIDYTLDEEGEQDEIYRTSVTKYHNRSYFLNGLVKETAVYKGDMANNELYSKSENTYEIRRLEDDNNSVITTAQGILPEDYDVGGSEGRRSAAVFMTKTKSYVYELGSSPLISESEMVYDQKGRVTEYKYLGAPGNNQDNYTTEIIYHSDTALENKNIISVPAQVLVKVNNQVKRKRQTDNIDLSTGVIKTIKHFYATNDFAQVDLKYDQYGNIVKVEYPENNNAQRMSYTYEYDTAYNKHVTKVTDAFGYSSETEYDFKFDVPLEVTDIAGNKTRYTYDTFGRMTEVLGPKEMPTSQSYTIKFEYFPKYSDIQSLGFVSQNEFVPVAQTMHYDPQHPNNTIDTYTFIDGLARPVQVKKDITVNLNSSNPSANPNYEERMSVSGAVVYDEFGRAVKQYHPVVENKSNTVNFKYNPAEATYYTQSIYDPLDRVVETLDEVGSQAFMEYSVDGNLHKTRSEVQQTSGVNVISESFKDVNGRVVKTNNVGPQGDIITLFDYNAIGELLSYTDDMSMTTGYKYDMLGRKTTMSHPDRGETHYYYDKASNLTRLQTANLIQQNTFIQYEYEFNRLYRIIFPQPDQSSINIADVYYQYGAANSGNETGRLIYQQDASGVQEFEYGNMGELVYNKRTVVAPSPTLPIRTFETRFVYDSWNRLQEMTYPDGEGVRYSYDFGGNLKGIYGDMPYVERVDYNHYGERTYIQYGNGTETVYDYTPELRRLNGLHVLASNNEVLLNNSYEYDKVGNVLDIKNTASFSSANLMGGQYNHRYSYDNLNRLANARGGFEGHPEQQALNNDFHSEYNLDMTYDTTHRIVNKLQNHNKNGQTFLPNTYDNHYEYYENTHRVKQITDAYGATTESFVYDLNGNIIQRNDDATKYYFWDEADRLRVLYQGDELLHHYVYDAGGQRVLKASSHMEAVYENGQLVDSNIQMGNYTSYPSAFLVVDPDGIYSKHYYAGTQRIAARMGQHNADEIFADSQPKSGQVSNSESTGNDFNADELKTLQRKDLQSYLDKAGKEARLSFKEYKPNNEEQEQAPPPSEGAGGGSYAAYGAMAEELIYYYHPDHLGTATYLTDINGYAYEFFLNLPFGETMAEQHSQTADYVNRWKFTGHELDRETGLYYANARYYDPRTSIFISVDPLAEEFPGWNPYHYVHQNPINLIDPTGMSADSPDNEYRAVWNQEKQQYEHTQVSNLGEHLFDVIHYEGGEKDGTIDVSFNPDLQFAEEQQVSGNNGESFTIPPQRFTPERGGILGTRTAPGEWKLEHRGANGAATPGFFAELLPLPKVGLAGKLLGALGVKFGSKAVKEGGYLVYQGLDKSGAVKYVGITSRGLAVRAAEHKAAGGAKAGLEFIAIGGMQNLSKTQARVFEQQLINQFGLKKNGGLLLNKINSIAPKNWSQHGIKP